MLLKYLLDSSWYKNVQKGFVFIAPNVEISPLHWLHPWRLWKMACISRLITRERLDPLLLLGTNREIIIIIIFHYSQDFCNFILDLWAKLIGILF